MKMPGTNSDLSSLFVKGFQSKSKALSVEMRQIWVEDGVCFPGENPQMWVTSNNWKVFVLSLFLQASLYEVLGSLLDVSRRAAKCRSSSLELAAARVMCWASFGDVGSWLCAWGLNSSAQNSSNSSAAQLNNQKLLVTSHWLLHQEWIFYLLCEQEMTKAWADGFCLPLSPRQHHAEEALVSYVPGKNRDLLILFPRQLLRYNTVQEHSGKSTCFLTLSSSSAGRSWGCFAVMLFGNFYHPA